MLIAQLSDLHIAGWGKKTFGVAPMAENLSRCVDHINALNSSPDLVLITGDIANDKIKEEVERAVSILDRLHAPYYLVPGNHDRRADLLSIVNQKSCPTESEKFIHYTIEGHDLRLIAVDSMISDAAGGELCDERVAWLDEKLGETDQPTVLFMHHPPLNFGVAETDIDGFIGAGRLGSIVKKHGTVVRILSGHIHLSAFAQWRGTIVSTAPSIGMKLFLDLTLELPSGFVLDDPRYHLHHWTADGILVTHTITVRSDRDVYPFEDDAQKLDF